MESERALLDFVLAYEGHIISGLCADSLKWRAEAHRNRREWERGNADPAYRAELDARPAMSHERYRINAEACEGHAERADSVAVGLRKLIGVVEADRSRAAR